MTEVYLGFTGLAKSYTEILLSATEQKVSSHSFPFRVRIASNGMIYYNRENKFKSNSRNSADQTDGVLRMRM
jgi:hypothetical protein